MSKPVKGGFDASVSVNTAKRREKEAVVEALHSKTFGAWANHQLSRKGYEKLTELTKDLADGVKLIHLLQAVYDEKVERKYDPAPATEILRVENVAIALELLNKHMTQVQINSKDIVDCNRKLTLGLVYRLIMEHQMLKPEEASSTTTVSQRNKAAKSNLLTFCKSQTVNYEVEVNDLVESFYDGKAFCAMVDSMKPGVINWADVANMEPVDRLNLAFTVADKEFGIPKLLDAADLVNPDVDARADEKCLMTYLSEFPLAHLAMLQKQQDSTNLREKDLQEELEKEREKQKSRELERLREKENQDALLKLKDEESEKLRDTNIKLKEQHEDAKKLAQQKREEIKNQNDTIREENKRLEEELKRLREEIAQLHDEVKDTKSKLIGKLHIVAKEARNLPAVNLGGKSDPYLKFNLENQQFKTKVKKRNLNPKWEQEFEFFVTDRNSELSVSVFDWDRFTKDEFIGQFVIPIAELKDGQSEQKWYTIYGSDGTTVINGEVSLVISFKLGK